MTSPFPLEAALAADRPSLKREGEVPSGAVFWFAGRPLRIVKAYGSDAAAPVLVEEMIGFGDVLQGQLSLWSAQGVTRAMAGQGGRAK